MERFPISIDPNDCDGQIAQILARLKPEWPKDQVKRKNFSHGMMNVLLCCHLESDVDLNDAIIFRIAYDVEDPKRLFGATKEEIICNSQVAQGAGSGAPVLALFQNGLVTKCLPGKAATRRHLREERLISQTARLLAQFHYVDLDKLSITNSKGKPIKIEKKVRFFNDLYYVLEHLPEKGQEGSTYPKDEYFSKESLRKEIKSAEDFINSLGFRVVYSHNDFHSKNLVYDKKSDKMMMIDFDISGYNHEGFDIGAILEDRDYAVYLGFCEEDDPPDMTDEEIKLWSKYYLTARAELIGDDPSAVTEKDIEIHALKCKISIPYFHLLTIMWALANHNNPEMKSTETFSIVHLASIARKLYVESMAKITERVEKLNKLMEK